MQPRGIRAAAELGLAYRLKGEDDHAGVGLERESKGLSEAVPAAC